MTDETNRSQNTEVQPSETLNTFQWNIAKFTDVVSNARIDQKIVSPVFVGKSTGLQTLWRIAVYPKGKQEPDGQERNRLDISLEFSKNNNHNLVVKARCGIFLPERLGGERYHQEFAKREFGSENCSVEYHSAPYSILFDPSHYGFRSEDMLRVKIKLWIQNDEIGGTALKIQEGQLHGDLSQLLSSSKFSDLSIIVEDLVLKAHKNILACRSQVFATMLQNDMSESLTNTITIEDFSARTVQGMLEYVYSENVECVNEDYVELLKIAEKYELKSLKIACSKHAVVKMSTENAFELLVLGDMYNATDLKSKALDFINSNKSNCMFPLDNENATELQRFAEAYLKLILEIYQHLRKNSFSVVHSTEESKETEEMTIFTTRKRQMMS